MKAKTYMGEASELKEELRRQREINAELLSALQELVTRCDGLDGVRADGTNIQTIKAHAVIAKVLTRGLDAVECLHRLNKHKE